jgi:hypothetical protein
MGAGLALAFLVTGPTLASANPTCYTSGAPGATSTPPGNCTTPTQPPAVVQAQANQAPVVVATPKPAASGSLAFTGADVAGLLAIATVIIGAGVAMVVMSRRRRSTV